MTLQARARAFVLVALACAAVITLAALALTRGQARESPVSAVAAPSEAPLVLGRVTAPRSDPGLRISIGAAPSQEVPTVTAEEAYKAAVTTPHFPTLEQEATSPATVELGLFRDNNRGKEAQSVFAWVVTFKQITCHPLAATRGMSPKLAPGSVVFAIDARTGEMVANIQHCPTAS